MISLLVQPGLDAAQALTAIKALSWDFPGEEELEIRVPTKAGIRHLRLGPLWTYDGSHACRAALAEFGEVT